MDAVRAVAIRDGNILWGIEAPVQGRPIGAVVDELFAARRFRGWPRPTIIAVIGPARSQLRRLSGLPSVVDAVTLTRLISESAGRFFLRNGVPLVTTSVRRGDDGEGWCAAIEQPVIAALEAACRAHGLRLAAVLPTLSVIPHALQGDSLTWHDGDVRAHLTLSGGRLSSLRRTTADASASCSSDAEPPHAIAALAALGADGWRFADAYGAAVASTRDPLAHQPARSASAAPMRAWRLAVAGAAFTVALASAVLAPIIAARHAAAQAAVVLAAVGRERRAADAVESNLAHVSAALEEAATFDHERRSATLLVGDLARALPVGGALVALRVDSAGGTLVALVPRAASLIERLERMPTLSTPTIIGPVTREVVANSEVERVSIRFGWTGSSAHETTSRTNVQRTP
jgi:hypothetical protein